MFSRLFKLVREAGLEPARPEWTLEPELKNYRFNTYRQVLLCIAQSVENTGFFESFPRNANNRARCRKKEFR